MNISFSTSTFLLTAAMASIVGLTGCNNDATHSQYPDKSVETRAQAQAIRDDAQRSNDSSNRDQEQRLTALSFRTSQAEQKAKQAHEQIAINLDHALTPLKAAQDQAKATGSREREAIDQEGEGAPVNPNNEEVIRIKADKEVRKVKSQQVETDILAENEAKILALKNEAAINKAKIVENEASEKAVIKAERSEAEQQNRERKLAISIETTSKLDKLGEKSADRREETGKQEAAAERQDQNITAAVRKAIARGDSARDVTISTRAGIVVLTGVVASEVIRREVIADATKVVGVVRLDDKMSIR